jgi:Xaa-Pro aminopeptidase
MNTTVRLKKLKEILVKEKLTAFIVATTEGNNKNVFYLSSFGGTTGVLIVTRKKVVLAVDGRYILRAKKEVKGISVVSSLPGKKDTLSGYLVAALNAVNLPKQARVGYEGMKVPVLVSRSWAHTLPFKLVPTKNVIERLRGIKDKEEVRALAYAARMTSRALSDVLPRIRKGMTESHVALLIEYALRKRGAVQASFDTIVASGSHAAIPHHKTSTRTLKPGESVVIDFGGLFPSGYVSDITRTLFVPGKKPHPRLVDAYKAVLIAHKKAYDALKPGIMWSEYDHVARSYIKERGFGEYFTHGVGHSLGLEVHDPYEYDQEPIREGMVLTLEPGIYLPELGGVRIEDDVVITRDGARKLSHAPYLSGTMSSEKRNSRR